VKPPDLYKDWIVLSGVILMLIGSANWLIGLRRTQQYSLMIAAMTQPGVDEGYRSFDELDAGSDRAVLAPFEAAQRRVSYATAHLEFYRATFETGRVLFLLGVVVSLIGFLGALRRDAKRAVIHLSTLGGSGYTRG
jgi:hypothetical protein